MRACLLLVLAVGGCSSIPDVEFVDDVDAGGEADAARPPGGDGGGDGDSGAPPDAGEGTAWRCPDAPPPAGAGVCCGARLCLGCTEAHCGRCARVSCGGDEVCCARTSSPMGVDCRAPSTCR